MESLPTQSDDELSVVRLLLWLFYQSLQAKPSVSGCLVCVVSYIEHIMKPHELCVASFLDHFQLFNIKFHKKSRMADPGMQGHVSDVSRGPLYHVMSHSFHVQFTTS